MVYTRTFTSTKTFLRVQALKLQLRIALRRALRPGALTQASIDGIMKGVDKEYIEWLRIYGFDVSGRARCELSLHIDWNRYEVHIGAGRTTIEIDDRWPDQAAIELNETLELFNEFVVNNNLSTKWRVAYRPWLSGEAINRELGFVTPKPLTWAGKREGFANVIPELDEIRIEFWMVT
ncbi:MAG TPA: hypothetical protein VKJ45_11745 [Blastocatellia bacterium]|nr:hypothetical protein [Blastocatellia bacterium]